MSETTRNNHNPRSNKNNGSRHNPNPNYGANERKKKGIRGHDAALYNMVRNEEEVTVLLKSPLKLPRSINKSDLVTGKLIQYDAYTITMSVEGMVNPLILFKSTVGGLTKAVR